MKRAFLSYSKADSRIARQLRSLFAEGGWSLWTYEEDSVPGPSYLEQTERAIRESELVVVLVSESSLSSNQVNTEVISAHERQKPFMPLLHRLNHDALARERPTWRRVMGAANAIRIPVRGTRAVGDRILRGLAEFSESTGRLPESSLAKMDEPVTPGSPSTRRPPRSGTASREDLRNKPNRKPRWIHVLSPAKDFVGRQEELEALRRFWESDKGGVLALVGIGGTGKTSLVEHFVRGRLVPECRHASSFLGWSFYENVNSGELIDAGCEYLSITIEGQIGEQGRLRRLKNALASGERHVLVLDGMERIQQERPRHADHRRAFGEILDPNIRDLLRSAASGMGKCKVIVTTRFPLADLEAWRERGYTGIDLNELPAEDACQLLRKHGIRGTDRELRSLLNRYGRHALTLTHLGGLLSRFFRGDPGKAPELGDLSLRGDDATARRFDRVLCSYREYLPPRELVVMNCLSVFRQAVAHDELVALVGRFDAVMTRPQIDDALAALASYHLLVREPDGRYNLHPYIRDHFYRSFEGATQAHESLASRLSSLTDKPGVRTPAAGRARDRLEELIDHLSSAGHAGRATQIFLDRMGGGFHLAHLGEFARGLRIVEMLAERLGKPPFEIDPDGYFALRRGAGELMDLRSLPLLSWISSDHKISCRLLRGELGVIDSAAGQFLREGNCNPQLSRDFSPRFSALLLSDRFRWDGSCWSDTEGEELVDANGLAHLRHDLILQHRNMACHHPPWVDEFVERGRLLRNATDALQQANRAAHEEHVSTCLDCQTREAMQASRALLDQDLEDGPVSAKAEPPTSLPIDGVSEQRPLTPWAELEHQIRRLGFLLGLPGPNDVVSDSDSCSWFWQQWRRSDPDNLRARAVHMESSAWLESVESAMDAAADDWFRKNGFRPVRTRSATIAHGPLNDAVVRLWRAEAKRLSGDLPEGRRFLEQADKIIAAASSVEHLCLLQLVKGRFAIDEGLDQVAAIELRGAVDDARRAGFRLFEIDAELELGRLALRMGDFASAVEHAERARGAAWEPDCGYVWAECMAWAILAKARAGLGAHEDAGRAEREFREMRRRLPASFHFDAMLERIGFPRSDTG